MPPAFPHRFARMNVALRRRCARPADAMERHTAVTRGTSLRNCDSLRSPESATGCHRTRRWNVEEGGNDGEDTPPPSGRRPHTEADPHDLRRQDARRDRGAVRDQPDRRADRHARVGARGDAPGERPGEPRQHRLGAGHRVPRLLHAGRVHGVGSRLRPVARDRERPHRMHRRHVPVRPPVLGVRVRVHVRRRQRPDRLAVLPPARRAGHLRLDRRGVPGVLAVPVRVRRHVLHDHVGRHGRSHGVQGRSALLDRRLRASSTRSSVTGCGVRAAGSAT